MKIESLNLSFNKDLSVKEANGIKEFQKQNASVDAEKISNADKNVLENQYENAQTETRVEGRVEYGDLKSAVAEMNSFLESMNKSLSFFVDEKTGKFGVKVIDDKTKEVIKQIPPQEILDVAAKIKEMIGVFLDKIV